MILIGRKIATNSWPAIDVGSPDITAVKIKTHNGCVILYNLYCDCTHSDSLFDLKKHLQAHTQDRENSKEDAEIIWLGDFNRHHPLWDDEWNTHLFMRSNLNEAQISINATINYNLQITLPKSLPTLIAMLTGNYTRTDNVFMSSTLTERLITCTTVPEDQPAKSNHFPIDTTLELKVHTTENKQKFNFHETDWKIFSELLESKLQEAILHATPHSHQHFCLVLLSLTNAIMETTESIVPKTKPSPYMKCWRMLETQLRTET